MVKRVESFSNMEAGRYSLGKVSLAGVHRVDLLPLAGLVFLGSSNSLLKINKMFQKHKKTQHQIFEKNK